MKFRRIKKIQIGGVEFDVKWNKDNPGGKFHFPSGDRRGEIEIGTMLFKTNPLGVLDVIIHELKEIIQEEQGARWSNNGAEEYHYNHSKHTDFCSRLARLLPKFVRFEK